MPETNDNAQIRAARLLRLQDFGAMANSMPCGLTVLSLDGEIVYVNDAMVAITGVNLRVAYGKKISEVSAEDWDRLQPVLQRVISGERVMGESIYQIPPSLRDYSVWGDESEREVEPRFQCRLEYFPVRDDLGVIGVGVIGVDVSKHEDLYAKTLSATNRYDVLSDVAQAAVRMNNADDLYEKLVETLIKVDGVDMAWIGIHENGQIRKGPSAGIDEGYLAGLTVSAKDGDPYAQGPAGQAILTGKATILNNFQDAPMSEPWHHEASRVGFRSSATFPLKSGGGTVGMLTMYSRTAQVFDEATIDMMNVVRSLVTLALNHYEVLNANVVSHDILRMRDGALGTISQGITIVDAQAPDMPIIYASPSFMQMTGYSRTEVVGRNCRFLQGPDTNAETVRAIREAVAARVGIDVEILNYTKSGHQFWNNLTLSPVFDDEGRLTRYVGVQSDVTEKRRLEAKLIQSQRLEAIGTLAGGIAHDFNNLLLVMQGYTTLLLRELSDQRLHDIAQRIQDAVNRGADFTRHLLAYSRQQVSLPKHEELNLLVRDGLTLLMGMLGTEITLMTDLDEQVSEIFIDGSQFQQIMINLVANARDSMLNGGTLVVRTQRVTLDDEYTSRHGEIEPGEFAMLEVTDTGVGMSKSVLDRVFEPFFTTKELGTGLGLASVIGIVKQNHGHIAAYSEEGLGSTFKVYFPLATEHEKETVPFHQVSEDADSEISGSETILVVEDDEEVRLLVVTALRELGYDVLQASNGPMALDLARSYEGTIDVLITDVIMPEMNGRQVSEQLLATRPSLKVIFTSGYPSNVLRDREFLDEHTVFIEKPYSSLVVARSIRSLLES